MIIFRGVGILMVALVAGELFVLDIALRGWFSLIDRKSLRIK